jgi:Fic/DOC family
VTSADDLLVHTPYLIAHGVEAQDRFEKVRRKSLALGIQATEVFRSIREQTHDAFDGFWQAYRSDLVAESNRMEGYEWTQAEVSEAVNTHSLLLQGPTQMMLEAIRRDRHLAQAIGLFKAEQIAEELAAAGGRPRQYEIRALHALVAAGESFAGAYKTDSNRIAGTKHRTTEPLAVPHAMAELVDWWQRGSGDAVLDAAVVHAWLTHIHPFDDGNGRLARLLANAALVQAGYPALMLRSETDRGKYLDVLGRSDEGDILPLYDFVVMVVQRAVRLMNKPNYVARMIDGRLLRTPGQRFGQWRQYLAYFAHRLSIELHGHGWEARLQGYPDPVAYRLLEERDIEGNSWFLKINDTRGRSRWLLWFGYTPEYLAKMVEGLRPFPAIYFDARDDDPRSVYPFRQLESAGLGEVPYAVVIAPLMKEPAKVYRDGGVKHLDLDEAARRIVDGLITEAAPV